MPEKKVVSLDSQWINTLQLCPRRAKYYLLEHLRPRHTPEPLERGSLLHHIFDHYYKGRMEGKKHSDNLKDAIEAGNAYSQNQELEISEIAEVLVAAKESLNFHANDSWLPVAVEQPFSYILYEDDEIKIVSTGVIDLIVDIKGIGLTVVDHKSSKRQSNPLPLSNQFMNYCRATDTVRAVVNQVGFQKTVAPELKFKRIVLSYQRENLEEWMRNTVYWIKLGLSYIEEDNFPMNLTSCDKFGACPFVEVCTAIPSARDWKKGVKFVVGKPWDPYTKD